MPKFDAWCDDLEGARWTGQVEAPNKTAAEEMARAAWIAIHKTALINQNGYSLGARRVG